MNLIDLFRRRNETSASIAKERLQIILAHERSDRGQPEFLPRLQKELMAVIARYVQVEQENINVTVQRDETRAILEINVELPPKN